MSLRRYVYGQPAGWRYTCEHCGRIQHAADCPLVLQLIGTLTPMISNSYSRDSWRVRILDAAAASSDPARNARAWAAGWTPPGYALYSRNVAAYVRHSTLAVDSASESGHITQQTAA